jgi:hypothetical protein
MKKPQTHLLFIPVVGGLLGGCFPSTESSLVAGFCYATEDGSMHERGPAGEASHTLVARMNLDEVDVPVHFALCAEAYSQKAVWADENGSFVFLGVHFDGPEHEQREGVLDGIEGAQLEVAVLSRRERAMTITRDGEPLLGVFKSVPLDTLAISGLDVWLQFPSTLPSVTACGSQVEVALMVGGDDVLDSGPTIIPNGVVENVTVNGRTLAIANVRSMGVVTTNSQGGWCPEERDKEELSWSLSSVAE